MRWLDGINGHEFEQTQGDSEGQGSLVCCSPWGHKELDMTQQLNNESTKMLTGAFLHDDCLPLPSLPSIQILAPDQPLAPDYTRPSSLS